MASAPVPDNEQRVTKKGRCLNKQRPFYLILLWTADPELWTKTNNGYGPSTMDYGLKKLWTADRGLWTNYFLTFTW
jgi:hypothetical protein